MEKTYTLNVAGLKRDLKFYKIDDNLSIAAFIMFGDVELTEKCAEYLAAKAPEHDVVFTAECKSIPLVYEYSKQTGKPYVVARKGPKVYMEDVISTAAQSITTVNMQKLCIGKEDVQKLSGKKVLIMDDVISTGGSLNSLEYLVKKAGGEIVGKMAVLAEGEAADREDLIFLEKLPLFDGEGNEI